MARRLALFDVAAANRVSRYCSNTFPFGIVPMVGNKSPTFGPQTKKAAVQETLVFLLPF